MCWDYDDDGGFIDEDDIKAIIYDIYRKSREEEALIDEINKAEREKRKEEKQDE